MAYTNSPQFNTYKTIQVPFIGEPMYRTGDLSIQRDCNIINFIYDVTNKKEGPKYLKKRPGLTSSAYSLSKVADSDIVRGSFYDVDQNAFYWVVGTKLYNCKPDVGTTINLIATINTSSGYVGFCSFLKSDNTRYVCVSDGTDLWIHDYVGATCNRVVDADMPTPHQPYPLYIDGYVLLIKTNTGDIYNSDLDDPTSWTAGNFISAEISSDYALRLIKAKNYVVCMGYNSIEYFYDAGNASGSPFSRNDSPFRSVGYVTGLCTIGDTSYFVGQDDKQNIAVYALNSFKVEQVSNEIINRTLQNTAHGSDDKSQVTLNQDGYCVSIDGHSYYCLVTPQTTWVYDVEEKLWYEWKGNDGTGLKFEGVFQMYRGLCYPIIKGQPTISIFGTDIYQDFTINFECIFQTDPVTADTYNWKTCHKAHLICDQYLNTGTSNAVLSWSDRDGTDNGTLLSRNINVFSQSPFITALGRFRTRSFTFSYSDNYPLRVSGMELDINVGTH